LIPGEEEKETRALNRKINYQLDNSEREAFHAEEERRVSR
jgi:hypothetical protein